MSQDKSFVSLLALTFALLGCAEAPEELPDPEPPVAAPGGLQAPTEPIAAPFVDVTQAPYNANGDDPLDDGPAIQAAINDIAAEGGGIVFIPEGTFYTRQTFRLGNGVTVQGAGRDETTIIREPYGTHIGIESRLIDGECVPVSEYELFVYSTFVNDNYNCGNEGIEIRDLTIDGSMVTYRAIAIALSGIKDTTVDSVRLVGISQDGIFLKNGGQNVKAVNNEILGFNLHWYNGAGINVEMHDNIAYPGGPLIAGNEIWAIARPFCTDDVTRPCDTDSDCVAGTCPQVTQVDGIGVTAVSGPNPGTADIIDNTVYVSEGNKGLRCVGCDGSEIAGNTVQSVPSSTPNSGRMWGMFAYAGNDLLIYDNEIIGSGNPGDVRGALIERGSGLRFADNQIVGQNITLGSAALTIRDEVDYELTGNVVAEIESVPSLELTSVSCATTGLHGVVEGNIFEAGNKESAVVFRSQSSLRMVDNTLVGPTETHCDALVGTVFADRIASGPDAGAYAFNRNDHQVRVPEPLVPPHDPFTVVARVRPTGTLAEGGLFGQYFEVVGERMAFTMSTDTLRFQVGDQFLTWTGPLDPGWHWVAVSRDSAGMVRLYIDGDGHGEASMPGPIDQRNTSIGRLEAGIVDAPFRGDIDDLWVFDGALDDGEIHALSLGADPDTLGVSYWSFQDWADITPYF